MDKKGTNILEVTLEDHLCFEVCVVQTGPIYDNQPVRLSPQKEPIRR